MTVCYITRRILAFKVWSIPSKFFCKDYHDRLLLWIVWCHSLHFVNWQKAQIGRKFDIAASFSFFFFFEIKFWRWLDKKIRYCHNIAIPKLCGAPSFPLQDILHHISHIIQNGCISVREEFHWDWMDLKNSENGWLLNTISMVYMWLEK